jgi:hypothetical protein
MIGKECPHFKKSYVFCNEKLTVITFVFKFKETLKELSVGIICHTVKFQKNISTCLSMSVAVA